MKPQLKIHTDSSFSSVATQSTGEAATANAAVKSPGAASAEKRSAAKNNAFGGNLSPLGTNKPKQLADTHVKASATVSKENVSAKFGSASSAVIGGSTRVQQMHAQVGQQVEQLFETRAAFWNTARLQQGAQG